MAEYYLLESSATDGYLLEDGTGLLLREGQVTLTAEPGAYAITGAAAMLALHRRLAASAGVYSLTGAWAELIWSALGPAPHLVLFSEETFRIPAHTLERFAIADFTAERFATPAFTDETFTASG